MGIHEETAESLVIREAIAADIPALAALHVTTWNATHAGPGGKGPTCELRAWQWRETFKVTRIPYAHPDQSDYSGELSKIYLLGEYQRRGLGRRLIGHVARRFLSQGISSMLLFGVARNPSCRFYEALGGRRLVSPGGQTSEGNYGWRDLGKLAVICPVE